MTLKIYCDGGARGNPGPAAAAFVVKDTNNKIIFKQGKYFGELTNNQAEYHGALLALKWLGDQKASQVDIYLDSRLVVNQLKGLFKIKNAALRELFFQAKILESKAATSINYHLLPRELNTDADAELNRILDEKLLI